MIINREQTKLRRSRLNSFIKFRKIKGTFSSCHKKKGSLVANQPKGDKQIKAIFEIPKAKTPSETVINQINLTEPPNHHQQNKVRSSKAKTLTLSPINPWKRNPSKPY